MVCLGEGSFLIHLSSFEFAVTFSKQTESRRQRCALNEVHLAVENLKPSNSMPPDLVQLQNSSVL